MARTTTPAPAAPKEPGRLKQMYQVFQMTTRYDKLAIWWLLAGFLAPVLLGVLLAFLLSADQVLGFVLYIIAGVLGVAAAVVMLLSRLLVARRDWRPCAGDYGRREQ